MHVFAIREVLCVFGCVVVGALCVSESEGNYVDNYDNEISQDQQEGESPATPCQAAEFSHWDKLFIALEDSHMRQNMLLESLEQCCGGMASLRTQAEKLAGGTALEAACRAQVEQVSLRLQRGLMELREEEAERERRLNTTLLMLLRSCHEGNVRLKRLEEGGAAGGGHRVVVTSGPGDGGRMRHQPTPRPGGSGATFTLGMKPFQQEVTSPLDMDTMQRALVAIATELQRVHLQLSRVIEQAGALRKDNRGDT
ncbi:hypothetical protein INR49_031381 [Caranx melampygus]|nr:hypothetical protein INR49_031381 [Caranx melampygus]